MPTAPRHSGRCYCGATTFELSQYPLVAAMCHCGDCMRWTGAPSPVFVAFPANALANDLGDGYSTTPGINRWNCPTCGSPIAATFDYLPDQIYFAVGVLNHPERYQPDLQCYTSARLPWVHVAPNLPEVADTGQEALNAAQGERT